MFFTRFPINMTRRETLRILASPYRMHAAIMGSFPPSFSSNKSGRVLWRIDNLADGGKCLYIVSPSKPSLVGLDEQIGFPDIEPSWKIRDYTPFLQHIENGQQYSFRLVANPVVSRSARQSNPAATNDKSHRVRLPHVSNVQRAAWLIGKNAYSGLDCKIPELFLRQETSRCERNGFKVLQDGNAVPQLIVSNIRELNFNKGLQKTPITLVVAQYDGVLEVVDAAQLRHTLIRGIGHGKGFGCGLLTLVNLKEG